MSVVRRFLSVSLLPLILSALAAIGCYVSAGATLGVFLGGLIMVALLAPPLTLAEETSKKKLIVLAAIVLPFMIAWLVATFRTETYLGEWARCVAVLIAFAAALAGISTALKLARLPGIPASALTITLALLWLTWPIWLSRTWSGEQSAPGVARLVVCHPAMAINSQLVRPHGLWTEQSIAYHLTDLSQNVPYTLPRSVWPCVLVHSLVGALFVGLAAWYERQNRSTATAPAASPPASP